MVVLEREAAGSIADMWGCGGLMGGGPDIAPQAATTIGASYSQAAH